MTMSKVNPYRVTRATAAWAGRGLVVGMVLVLFALIVAGVWQSWGAWALTMPLIIAGVAVGLIYVCVFIDGATDAISAKWRKAENEWGRR